MGSVSGVADAAFLIDSDIAIYILEGREWRLRAAIERRQPGEIAISTISVAEVMRGIDHRDRPREALARRLFAAFPIIAFDLAAAEAYRRVPFRRGRFDSLIAAHALSRGLVLVTNNERDFATISELRVENWTRP
jgi:tRNA(fMet)-specific endonuclease VapC